MLISWSELWALYYHPPLGLADWDKDIVYISAGSLKRPVGSYLQLYFSPAGELKARAIPGTFSMDMFPCWRDSCLDMREQATHYKMWTGNSFDSQTVGRGIRNIDDYENATFGPAWTIAHELMHQHETGGENLTETMAGQYFQRARNLFE